MKYPKINRQASREVNVPSLAGGLNLRDSLTGIRDNQMTDCVNMWYKDGMLRTRPAFDSDKSMGVTTNKITGERGKKIKVHSDIKTEKGILVSESKYAGSNGNGSSWKFYINFWCKDSIFFSKAGSLEMDVPEFKWDDKASLLKALNSCSYFLAEKDGVVYCYASNGEEFYIYKLDYINGSGEWEYIENSEIYAPTVYAHCQRTGWDDFEGTQFEGYNLIGNSYKMIYSAYNEADSDKSHPMRYKLGQELPDKGIIKVSITTCIKGDDEANERETQVITTEHIIKYKQKSTEEVSTETQSLNGNFINNNSNSDTNDDEYECKDFKNGEIIIEKFGEGNTSPDGLRLFLKYNYIGFVIASSSDGDENKTFVVATLNTDEKKQRYACNEDNIVITAPLKADKNNIKKVFCMTQNIWFGGAANGINGGSRLFLCGNTQDKEKSLVVWSSLNNPLYFGENNYAYVGDKSQAVTAFGQQGESLVIFKEGSTYYSYYVANNNIDADDLINQTVVDYEANSVYFPIIQLNGSVGCDCPNTVQLCRNRLVWTNSDGNVYTLYSNNQYSERTIYKVSDMIYPALLKENDLKNAVSCDFEGHYLLGVNNKIYVMDYNSYGYQYAASFSKTEDSNAQIPWYVWEFDFCSNFCIFSMQDSLSVGQYIYTDNGGMIAFSVLNVEKDDGRDKFLLCDGDLNECTVAEKTIKSKCATKLFDFLSAGYLKNIDRVSVGFGNNGGGVINVGFVTNAGSENETVTLCGANTDERDAAFVRFKNFYPTAKSVRTFGIKIECEGPLVVDGISLQYRLLGGVK